MACMCTNRCRTPAWADHVLASGQTRALCARHARGRLQRSGNCSPSLFPGRSSSGLCADLTPRGSRSRDGCPVTPGGCDIRDCTRFLAHPQGWTGDCALSYTSIGGDEVRVSAGQAHPAAGDVPMPDRGTALRRSARSWLAHTMPEAGTASLFSEGPWIKPVDSRARSDRRVYILPDRSSACSLLCGWPLPGPAWTYPRRRSTLRYIHHLSRKLRPERYKGMQYSPRR